MFGIVQFHSSKSMLESLLTAQLTKCDGGVFANPKGLVFWNGVESSARAIQLIAEEEARKKGKMSHFFYH